MDTRRRQFNNMAVVALRALAVIAVRRTQSGCIGVAYAALCLAMTGGGPAGAQAAANAAAGPINLGARGGLAPEAPPAAPASDPSNSPVEFSFRAGLATVYRGTTLSAHLPRGRRGGRGGARHGLWQRQRHQRQAAEPAGRGGHHGRRRASEARRRPVGFGATYFAYPGETPPAGVPAGINYWEAMARADTKFADLVRKPRWATLELPAVRGVCSWAR
jgi:hypothetical protein